jgi:hypothetical protein
MTRCLLVNRGTGGGLLPLVKRTQDDNPLDVGVDVPHPVDLLRVENVGYNDRGPLGNFFGCRPAGEDLVEPW